VLLVVLFTALNSQIIHFRRISWRKTFFFFTDDASFRALWKYMLLEWNWKVSSTLFYWTSWPSFVLQSGRRDRCSCGASIEAFVSKKSFKALLIMVACLGLLFLAYNQFSRHQKEMNEKVMPQTQSQSGDAIKKKEVLERSFFGHIPCNFQNRERTCWYDKAKMVDAGAFTENPGRPGSESTEVDSGKCLF